LKKGIHAFEDREIKAKREQPLLYGEITKTARKRQAVHYPFSIIKDPPIEGRRPGPLEESES